MILYALHLLSASSEYLKKMHKCLKQQGKTVIITAVLILCSWLS